MTVIPNNSKKISQLTNRKAVDTDILPIVRNGTNDRIDIGTIRTKYELELNGNIDYGLFYNWYAINTGKLAPLGYRIQTKADIDTFISYMGSDAEAARQMSTERYDSYFGTPIANPPGNPGWLNLFWQPTNEFNLSLFPSGWRNENLTNPVFSSFRETIAQWCSDEVDASTARFFSITTGGASIIFAACSKGFGHNTRFLRDASTAEQALDDGTYVEVVIDASGNIYGMVKIGTQIWSISNLKTTTYNDGTSIPEVQDNTDWANDASGAYCSYNNEPLETYSDDYVLPIMQISEDAIVCSDTNTLVILNGGVLNSYNYSLVSNLLIFKIEVKKGDILILKN